MLQAEHESDQGHQPAEHVDCGDIFDIILGPDDTDGNREGQESLARDSGACRIQEVFRETRDGGHQRPGRRKEIEDLPGTKPQDLRGQCRGQAYAGCAAAVGHFLCLQGEPEGSGALFDDMEEIESKIQQLRKENSKGRSQHQRADAEGKGLFLTDFGRPPQQEKEQDGRADRACAHDGQISGNIHSIAVRIDHRNLRRRFVFPGSGIPAAAGSFYHRERPVCNRPGMRETGRKVVPAVGLW